MKFGSLFTGIGGMDLGLERAGMTCAWQVEIDDYCNRVLAKHWPAVPRHRDVRDVSSSTVASVDLICGGFPCQPVSVAGKRDGQGDLRWLWPEFARVLGELRPRWALLENVPGLLTVEDGAGALVAADLAALGYDAQWGCISASSFGAPYRRSRWFCVANNDGQRFTWGTQQDCESFCREFESSRWSHVERCGEAGTDADESGLEIGKSQRSHNGKEQSSFVGAGWWAAEPDVVRVVSGFPRRVDRIRGLGNAVVPQVAEYLGRMIAEGES